MHESAVAENILEAVLAETAEKKGRILRVVMSCGQINGVNDEAMQFAFEAAAEGTVCQDSELIIKHIPLECMCKNCKKKFDFDFYRPQCPHCGKSDYDMGADAPLLLEQIEFQEE